MKRNLLHTIWVAAVVLLAASCERKELPGVGADGTQTLAITVTDGGYAPADRDGGSPADAPQTRAVENGYTTEFTAGDACGLYIVRGGELAYVNVKLTATAATDGTLTWQPEAGVTLTGGFKDEAYFLYYPYQEDADMKDQTDASATGNDAAFFDPLITGWIPKADQSKYAEGYTASDLMTATGTAKKNGKTISLTFKMHHRMALAVIELPKIVYDFTNEDIADYTVPTPTSADFAGSDAKPCRMTDDSYRYIVNPTATAPEITGNYADGSKVFTFTPSAATGSYKTYKIDGGSTATVEQTYTLQIGDYFCSSDNASGWYIIPKEFAPTENDNCIGIVLKAGRDDSGDWADNGNYKLKGSTISMSKVHGYVLALRDANGGNSCPWGSYGTEVGCDMNETTGFNGYSSTQTIVAFNNAQGGTLQDAFPAAYHATTGYEAQYQAPANTSGWFLPSGGQCWYWFNNRDVMLRSVQNAGGDGWKNWYWSSSEYYDRNPAIYVCLLNMLSGVKSHSRKNLDYAARACLAF